MEQNPYLMGSRLSTKFVTRCWPNQNAYHVKSEANKEFNIHALDLFGGMPILTSTVDKRSKTHHVDLDTKH